MGDKKFIIKENNGILDISFRWFSPVAFFLIFFCIAWDGFLFFWYSMAGDAPWIFSVFPIIHVAVGLGLSYYTICLFVNKTVIHVENAVLSVQHGPLPWVGNKKLSTEEIKQLYVKQVETQGKNGKSTHYELRAKMANTTDIKLVDEKVITELADAQFLERKIETHLSITDYKVEGEYQAEHKPSVKDFVRANRQKLDPINITLENLKKGFVLDYNMQTWEVIYHAQFDWKNGQSDHLFQLSNESSSFLLYMKKEMGLYQIWVEAKVTLHELEEAGVSDSQLKILPAGLSFKGNDYQKESQHEGKTFLEEEIADLGVYTQQAFYISKNHQRSLRVNTKEGTTHSIFLGMKVDKNDFSNILPYKED